MKEGGSESYKKTKQKPCDAWMITALLRRLDEKCFTLLWQFCALMLKRAFKATRSLTALSLRVSASETSLLRCFQEQFGSLSCKERN